MPEDVQIVALIPVETKNLLRDPSEGTDPQSIEWLGDPQGLARFRPYEAIHPVVGIGPMPGVDTTFYTSATVKSRVYIELVNASNNPAATCLVKKTTSGVEAHVYPSGTKVRLGSGHRYGPYDLGPGDTISGQSSPANSIHIHVIVDRYASPGDTP